MAHRVISLRSGNLVAISAWRTLSDTAVTATTDFLAPDIRNRCGRAFPRKVPPSTGPDRQAWETPGEHVSSHAKLAQRLDRRDVFADEPRDIRRMGRGQEMTAPGNGHQP
jgi:hypothetical protein